MNSNTKNMARESGPDGAAPPVPIGPTTLTTARVTGLLYLGLAVTGMLSFLVLRPQVFTDEGAATVRTLAENELVARLAIAGELGIVLTQALVAVWFFRLFRSRGAFEAGAIAAFGLVNAAAILGSAAALTTALDRALEPAGDTAGDTAGQVALLINLADNLWLGGALFFGLWLVPMGVLAHRAGLPRVLGWLLIVGGVGYVLSAFLDILAPGAAVFGEVLILPATAGELWMIGYLLHGGVFRAKAVSGPPEADR